MVRYLLFSVCAVSLLCACAPSSHPAAKLADSVSAPEFVYRFKSDIPPSQISRKKADLWEYLDAGFYVPLAAMRDSAKAWELARAAQAPKVPSHVQQLIIGGTAYSRTLLGPFKTKKVAQKELKELEKKKLVDTKLEVEYFAG